MDMIGYHNKFCLFIKKKYINSYINVFYRYSVYNKILRKFIDNSIVFIEKHFINLNACYLTYYIINDNLSFIFHIINNKIKIKKITSQLYNIYSYRLVYIDGMYAPSLSKTSYKKKEIFVLSHLYYSKKYNYIIKKYYGKISCNKHNFSKLNTVFTIDGSYICIHDNLLVDKPIQIIYFTTGYNFKYYFIYPRNLIIIGKNARLNIIESHHSLYIHNSINISVTEIYSTYNSYIEYFKIQNDIYKSSLVDNTYIYLNCCSYININTYSFNGVKIINNLRMKHGGERIISHFNGLTIIEKNSLVYQNIYIDHNHSKCKSYEFYKGIFVGKSNGIFDGKIVVRKNTNKIDAFQRNDNILLSKKAFINSNPILNIYSKEVKCSHACTIGILDQMSLFYFRSRGIMKKKAIIYLIIAYVCDILENIFIGNFKKKIYHMVINKLNVHNY